MYYTQLSDNERILGDGCRMRRIDDYDNYWITEDGQDKFSEGLPHQKVLLYCGKCYLYMEGERAYLILLILTGGYDYVY